MTLFTIRNIVSIVAGFNLAGPLFFLSIQNLFAGDYFMGGFLAIVGVFGLVLPEYLISRFIDKTIKNPAKRAGKKMTQTKSDVEDRKEKIKENVESVTESTTESDTDNQRDQSETTDGSADDSDNTTEDTIFTREGFNTIVKSTKDVVDEKATDVQDELNERRNG